MHPDIMTDPVMILFNKLPPAQSYLIDGFEPVTLHVQTSLDSFVVQCDEMKVAGQKFVDPDTTFLHDKISHALYHESEGPLGVIELFIPIVGELALNKSHYLRLALWLVCGRRDNENPFETEPGPETTLPLHHFADLAKQTAKNTSTQCVSCKIKCNPKHCTGCLVDEKWAFLGVAYCSKKCQMAHWEEHKSVCKHRKSLIVAVTQLRVLSNLFQSRTCDLTYAILGVKGAPHGSILLRQFYEGPGHDPNMDLEVVPEAFKGEFVFRELARGFLGPQAGDAEDYDNALIHYNRCNEHSGVEWPLIERLLEPFCKSITEVHLEPKNLAIVIYEKHIPGVANATIAFAHQVLCVELLSDEKFIIDLASAQFGWHETLSSASDFKVSRCARVLGTGRPGELQSQQIFSRRSQPPDLVETASYKLKKEVISAINSRAQELENQCRQRGETSLTPSTVGPFLSHLLLIAESAVNECLDHYKALDIYRLCLDRNGHVRVTTTAEEGQIYQNIWLTEEEYGPIKDNAKELLKLWKEKVARSRRGGDIKA